MVLFTNRSDIVDSSSDNFEPAEVCEWICMVDQRDKNDSDQYLKGMVSGSAVGCRQLTDNS